MKSIRFFLCFAPIVVGGWLGAALLCWPVLVALQSLTTALFIPHHAGTYRAIGFMPHAHLSDFPLSFTGAFSVPFQEMPLGFIILFWWLACATIVWNAHDSFRAPALSNRDSRLRKRRSIYLHAVKALLLASAVALALCIPFLRRYEIATDRFIYVKHFFYLRERMYPIASLRSINIDTPSNGKGPITWDFTFSSGDGFSMTAPDVDVLKWLLSKPGVSSNVRVVGRDIELK